MRHSTYHEIRGYMEQEELELRSHLRVKSPLFNFECSGLLIIQHLGSANDRLSTILSIKQHKFGVRVNLGEQNPSIGRQLPLLTFDEL